jgi:hypothetical protein
MQSSTKKQIAREWLTFVVAIVAGLTVAPIVVIAANMKEVPLSKLGGFYEALFSRREWYIAWLVALSPYLIFQLVRSLRWAVRTTREH